MYTLKVTRFRDGNHALEQATRSAALMDHLKASAGRYGFEVTVEEGVQTGITFYGLMLRGGNTVGEWEIFYGEAV